MEKSKLPAPPVRVHHVAIVALLVLCFAIYNKHEIRAQFRMWFIELNLETK